LRRTVGCRGELRVTRASVFASAGMLKNTLTAQILIGSGRRPSLSKGRKNYQ
jgi:hypothetical protein